ncbi:hypothetical protein VPHF92_0217 [Vibrio phage F92]
MIEFEKEWKEIYFVSVEDSAERNLHQEFADACGITRQQAKELCYKSMFQPQTPWLLKRMVDIGREMHKEMK